MKKNFIIVVIIVGTQIQAQIGPSYEASIAEIRNAKFIEKIAYGERKLTYADIEGSPYYNADFLPARFGNSSVVLPIRYDSFKGTIEISKNGDVYEVPNENIVKDSPLSKFTFEKSHEILILVDTHDDLSGYFFELVAGKNQLLKKIIVEFKPEVPAPNHLISGIPARFEKQTPNYFIKTDKDFIKIPKNGEDFLSRYFPENKDEINDFIKKNKIKLRKEADLIKLVNFLNTK
jgi:signal peptidase I